MFCEDCGGDILGWSDRYRLCGERAQMDMEDGRHKPTTTSYVTALRELQHFNRLSALTKERSSSFLGSRFDGWDDEVLSAYEDRMAAAVVANWEEQQVETVGLAIPWTRMGGLATVGLNLARSTWVSQPFSGKPTSREPSVFDTLHTAPLSSSDSWFPTERRPIRRPLDQETELEVVMEWVDKMGITIGELADSDYKREMASRLCYTWKDVFASDLQDIRPTDLVSHTVPLKTGARPYAAKMPLFTREEEDCIRTTLPKLEKAGIVTRCNSPWISRLKFVKKKDGKSLRWVNAFCPLNKATIKEPYPVPRLESIFNSIAKPEYTVFAAMDGSNGYWSIPMHSADASKTGFFTPLGQYCWTRMGQGLMGAVFTYSKFTDIAFGSIPPQKNSRTDMNPDGEGAEPRLEDPIVEGVCFRKFMDDNYLAATSFWQLFEFLATHYFPRCHWAPIALEPRKAFLFVPQIDVMGFSGSAKGLQPDAKKLAAFANYPSPTNPAEVERFCYMTPFLRWFIPGRAEHVRRMKQAVNSEGVFKWTADCEASFQHVKKSVLQNAVSSGDPARQYHLATDASLTGCGGTLFQILNVPPHTQASAKTKPHERLVMFMSRAFDSTQSNYSTTDREALACLLGLEEARPLILGSPFPTFLYTDHQALTKMLTSEDTRGRIARWQNKFAEYDVVVVHVPGKLLALADGLSRLPSAYQTAPVAVDIEASIAMFEDSVPSVTNVLAVEYAKELACADTRCPAISVVTEDPSLVVRTCRMCGQAFRSGSQLFQHLRQFNHHLSGPDDDRDLRGAPNFDHLAPANRPQTPNPHRRHRRRSSKRLHQHYSSSLLDALAKWAHLSYEALTAACALVVDPMTLEEDDGRSLEDQSPDPPDQFSSSDRFSVRAQPEGPDLPQDSLFGLLEGLSQESSWELLLVREWHAWLADPWYGPVVHFKLFGRVGPAVGDLGDWDDRRKRWARKQAMRYLLLVEEGRNRVYYKERTGELARCVTKKEVKEALRRLHEVHGHFGSRLTLSASYGRLYWPTRAKDVVEYCRSCVACQKTGNQISKTQRTNRPICQLSPWDMIGMDWLSITPRGPAEEAYVHVIIDYFSRYVCLKSYVSHRSVDTVDHCQSVFRRFGVPRAVYNDNGSHFTEAAAAPAFWKSQQVKQVLAPISHPASVGLSEVFVAMVRSVLRKLCLTDPRGPAYWPEYLPQVEWAINNKVMRVHGFTPAQLFFGRETRYPADDYSVLDDLLSGLIGKTFDELGQVFEANQNRSFMIALEESRERAIAAVLDHQDRVALSNPPLRTFEVGDLVLIRNFKADRAVGLKMLPKWLGPFEVTVVSHHKASLVVRELGSRTNKGRYSVNTVKLWVSRENRLDNGGLRRRMDW